MTLSTELSFAILALDSYSRGYDAFVVSMEKKLNWLIRIWPNGLDGASFDSSQAHNWLANSLGVGSFSSEVKK